MGLDFLRMLLFWECWTNFDSHDFILGSRAVPWVEDNLQDVFSDNCLVWKSDSTRVSAFCALLYEELRKRHLCKIIYFAWWCSERWIVLLTTPGFVPWNWKHLQGHVDVTMPPYHVIVIDSLSARLNSIEANARACIVRHMSVMLSTWFSHFSAFVKQLVEDLDLFDLECKLGMFRVRLFHCAFESVFTYILTYCITTSPKRIFRGNTVKVFVQVTCKNKERRTWHHENLDCETL